MLMGGPQARRRDPRTLQEQVMEELSNVQRAIVRHPRDGGHLLVLAGPGSGKTRVITERIGSLLTRRIAEPEQILVMTFTIKAATELVERLGHRLDTHVQGVWAGTFHSVCDRLLHEHGAAIGWGPPFSIFDTPKQELTLHRAARSVGWVLEEPRTFREVRDRVSQRKRIGLRADQQSGPGHEDPDYILAIDDAYRRLLAEQRALDYDDLILRGIQLLREDEETANTVQRRFRYVFVDEYHDLSPEQFVLLRTLVSPQSLQQIMVVADPNQAIYSWRQADATRMLRAYWDQYGPTLYRLEENHRSVGNLVRAAQHLIVAGGAEARAIPLVPEGLAIDGVACGTPEKEAEWLANQIARAYASGRYRYGDIAVLYRTHKRGDYAETALLKAGIPLSRIQADRFFDDLDVQAALRYLALVAALQDDSFEPALNWPRVLVDELTMVHLRKLAATHGCSLSTVARQIDMFADEVSPLTRATIHEFLSTIALDLGAVADRPIEEIVERLLVVLERRRSPLPPQVRLELRGVLDFLAPPLRQGAERLHEAIIAGQPVVIRHDGSIDGAAGATILQHFLTHYLHHPVQVRTEILVNSEASFIISCGGKVEDRQCDIHIGVRDARSLAYSISTQAWRLGQLLLMRYEVLRHGQFILYDLETTGHHVNTTEILELAALEIIGGTPSQRTFHNMVRPKGIISPDATKVHGITQNDVRTAPVPAHILPQFLNFLSDTTLVGHNVEQFDHPVLCRIARGLGLTSPVNPLIDTCALARRLLPGASHRLEDLAHQFGIDVVQTHRALDDVQLNAQVFEKLLDVMDQERELEIAAEVLPLVALGIFDSGVSRRDENAWLLEAGARACHHGSGKELVHQLTAQVHEGKVTALLQKLQGLPRDVLDEDRHWDDLRTRWRAMLQHYCRTFADQSLQGFLRFTALATAIDYQAEDNGRVALMTIHTAKGMEWPLVFVVGVEDGTLPFFLSKTPEALEEERRVLYVAMTRAKQRLCLSWATTVNGRQKDHCRFLADIPAELMTWRVSR
jgi:DNA polymerase III epsilon subunit family exonuclease